MKNTILTIIFGIALILTFISCEEDSDWDWISSNNSGVILNDTLYSTIQEAINQAADGDTIFLTEGIFADEGDKNLFWNGDEKHLTITLHENANARIECNKDGSGFIFDESNQNTSDIIDGITIRNCGDIYDAGIYCNKTNPIIRNCTFYNCDWSGIYCYNSEIKIENSIFYENKSGIICDESSNSVILNNIFHNNFFGIYAMENSNPSIFNNLIKNNEKGIYLHNAKSTMVNNTIVNNSQRGIKIFGELNSILINSIVWENGTNFVVSENKLKASYSCSSDSIASINPDSLGNIYENPLFVFSDDYHILTNSPCFDAGDSTAVSWDFDLDGDARILNENVDIGAYESGAKSD